MFNQKQFGKFQSFCFYTFDDGVQQCNSCFARYFANVDLSHPVFNPNHTLLLRNMVQKICLGVHRKGR